MKYYYAELDDLEFCDLWRFTSKKERDMFVTERSDRAYVVTADKARKYHKEQFAYWKKIDK